MGGASGSSNDHAAHLQCVTRTRSLPPPPSPPKSHTLLPEEIHREIRIRHELLATMSDAGLPTPNSTDPTQPQPPPEMEESQQEQKKTAPVSANVTFSIWPPSQRTRDAVVARLIETLSAPSVLSKRYGTIPTEEAASTARLIEEEAFAAAEGAASSYDDGIEILQIYSKEVSKRVLELVKSRSPSTAPSTTPTDSADLSAATASEDVASTVDSEA